VKLVENLVTRTDFNNHLESNRRKFDKIWATGRAENTAVRHEIATALQHSQEMLMDKLEKTARSVRQTRPHPRPHHRRPEQCQRAVAMTGR
jgi:DNA transposition AAA+ family ATPase